MSNTATQDVHLCARCKAVIEEETREVARAAQPLSLVPKPESDPPVAAASDAKPISEAPVSEMRASETRIAAATEPAPASVVAEARGQSVAGEAERADRLTEKDPFAAGPPTEKMKAATILPVEDLRDSPRRKLEVNVGIASDSHFFAGLSGDVSKGGLFVATYAQLALGGKVVLDFELPNGIIIVEGTVRWHRMATDNAGPGIGIQFENVPPETMALIERFCKARPPLYYDQADDEF